ncbi:hypothetical protein F4803DRAFT_549484 [Xylaria telfairii]|nr:hypothetical protein F4803DRAFT_549484 [Xylaria telfairii]
MSGYLDNTNPAPDDADPQQPSGPLVMWPAWSPGVPTSDPNGLWDLGLEVEALQPQRPFLGVPGAPNIAGNWPFELVYTSNAQSLFQVPGSEFLENPAAYAPVQATHGRDELPTPFTCIECRIPFRNNTKLLEHGKETGHRPYACYCGKRFSRLYTFTRHLGSGAAAPATGGVGGKHPCPLCTKYDGEKGFNRRDHLLQHLRVRHKIENKGIAFVNDRAGRTALASAEAVSNAADAGAQNVPLPQGDHLQNA